MGDARGISVEPNDRGGMDLVIFGLLAVCAVLLALGVVMQDRQRHRALEQLAPDTRATLFEHTRAIVEEVCPSAEPALGDFCRTQAELLLSMDECTGPCRAAASALLSRAGATR